MPLSFKERILNSRKSYYKFTVYRDTPEVEQVTGVIRAINEDEVKRMLWLLHGVTNVGDVFIHEACKDDIEWFRSLGGRVIITAE